MKEEKLDGSGGLRIFVRSWLPQQQVYAPDFALAVLKGLSHVAPHDPRAQTVDPGLFPRSQSH